MLRPLFLSFVVAICLMTTALSADDNVGKTTDPAGTWHWVQDYGQGPVKNWLILKTDGDQLTGDYVREESKKTIKDGKIQDGRFSFKLALENEKNGKPINVTCKGSVSGDELSGISSVVYEEQTTEFELKANRGTRPTDVVGNWKLRIDAEGQQFTPEVHIALNDDQLTANYVTEEVGTHEIKDLTLKDNELKFSLSLEGDNGKLDLKYEGIPRGDTITGKVHYEAGSTTGSADFTGKLTQATGKE